MYPKWISEISFVSTADQKEKSSENEKEKETTSTTSLYEYLFEMRNERKNHKAKEKTIRAYRIKSMSWGNIKTVDGSVCS